MKKNIFNNRKFKYGGLATVMTVGFLVLLVVLNVVVSLLLDRFPVSIDLTTEKRFEITDDSIELLKALEEDVTITVCADETEYQNVSEYYKIAYEVIRKYAQNSDRITLKFVDLLKNPTFVQNYPDLAVTTNDILVESAQRTKKVGTTELFEVSTSQYTGTSYRSKAEQVMTGAVLYVTDNNPSTVLIATGQSGIDMSAYQSSLEANNYAVQSVSLLTEELNQEASFIVLPQPDADLTAEQVKKLDAFLDNDGQFGKSLVFVASSTSEIGPVLKNFLAEWGLEVQPGMIYETNASYAVSDYYIGIHSIVDQTVAGQVTNSRLPVVVPFAHPIKALFTEKDNRSTSVILQSQASSVYIPANPGDDFDLAAQEQSAQSSIAMGTRYKYIDNVKAISNVVAVGSESMLIADFLTRGDMGNGSLMMAITNTIAEKEDTLQILPVDLSTSAITITNDQINVYMIVLVVAIPLLLLAGALVVWLRRRHL